MKIPNIRLFDKTKYENDVLLRELEGMGLIESRFFCCALTSIAVRLFGGQFIDVFGSLEVSS